jgi:hypothetical protein
MVHRGKIGTTGTIRRSPEMESKDIPFETPGAHLERQPAYLFQWEGTDLFAITIDPSGGNLPRPEAGEWNSRGEVVLGVRDPLPVPIDPEPVLRGLRATGFFTWRLDRTRPFGTSQ